MFQYHCLNPIASVGLDLFSDAYEKVEDMKDAQAVLVRSAAMHDLEMPKSLQCIARAGAGGERTQNAHRYGSGYSRYHNKARRPTAQYAHTQRSKSGKAA